MTITNPVKKYIFFAIKTILGGKVPHLKELKE
jgi:hypothetical protein